MSDFPKSVHISEEGPREGFQIEAGPIATADKIRFIEALAETGVPEISCVSFVNPVKVPGMADADDVMQGVRRRDGVSYTGLFLNMKGFERALTVPVDIEGAIRISASEAFGIRNTNMDHAATLAEQRRYIEAFDAHGIILEYGYVMTSFGCNYEGAITSAQVVAATQSLVDVAADTGKRLKGIYLADTVGWATPPAIESAVGAVRDRWPDFEIGMHIHDTRGVGLANAYAALRLGVRRFDSSCAGLGGCPFSGGRKAAGNICTEDFVFMCEEMGIETGVDLERMIECARMAELIVGHDLPGKVMHSGSLDARRHLRAAA